MLKEWKEKLQTNLSKNAAVRTKLILVNVIHADSLLQNNEEIYRKFLKYRVSDPYLKSYWNDLLNINDINWNRVYKQVNHLYDNRFK